MALRRSFFFTLLRERRKQAEIDVHRLEGVRLGAAGDMRQQGTQRRRFGRSEIDALTTGLCGSKSSGHQVPRRRFRHSLPPR